MPRPSALSVAYSPVRPVVSSRGWICRQLWRTDEMVGDFAETTAIERTAVGGFRGFGRMATGPDGGFAFFDTLTTRYPDDIEAWTAAELDAWVGELVGRD